jgi:glycosyltransferase involved in cell wall biosynthesis
MAKIFAITMISTYMLIKTRRNFKILIVYIGGVYLLIPMIISKLLKKKIILMAPGQGSLVYKRAFCKGFLNGNYLVFITLYTLERISYRISDRIVVQSSNLIKAFNIQKYSYKICVAGCHIDLSLFPSKENYSKNGRIIGYIGRLDEGKGVMNFLKAIHIILKTDDDLKFLIAGSGPLSDRIINEKNGKLSGKLDFIGWIPHEKVANYLNTLTLLVLPTYSEGVPNIILEAMASGTVVLATGVGGIPDIIKDGETGFILDSNSPESISEGILKVLENPNIDRITKNARLFVEKNFTYEADRMRWEKIFKNFY